VLVGTPYAHDPGYHGSWSRRVLGGRAAQEDRVEIVFGGAPLDDEAGAWRFTMESLVVKPSEDGTLDLAALPDATVTLRPTAEGVDVSSEGFSPDLQGIAESIVSDLYVAVPTDPRGVGGTFVSEVASAPGRTRVQEQTTWTVTAFPADGVQSLEGKWSRTIRPDPGLPPAGPSQTQGGRLVGMDARGVHSSSRHATVHGPGGSFVEVTRVGTGRPLR
jgi:hypothetical protein